MRYAQVIDGQVVNVILWDGTTPVELPGDLVNVDGTPCGPGSTYDGTTFTAPPAPEPAEVDDDA